MKGVLSTFSTKAANFLKLCKGNEPYFIRKHANWLSEILISGEIKQILPEQNEDVYPQTKRFKTLSRTTKYRSQKKLQEVLNENETSTKIKAFVATLTINDDLLPHSSAKSLETIINLCLASETAATEILNKINGRSEPYTPEQAVSILIDRDLSVENYNKFHLDLKNRGCDIYPPHILWILRAY